MYFLRRYYGQLIFLIIGAIVGFFISRLPLEFEPKTNWVSLTSLLLTIALALYLEFVVRPSFSNNRNEKDLLIDQLKAIRDDVCKLNSAYIDMRNTSPLAVTLKSDIVVRFRAISNAIDLLKQTDELCSITKKTVMSDEVFKSYLCYKKSLTGHKFNNASFFYDRQFWHKHEAAYKDCVKALMKAVISVNNQ